MRSHELRIEKRGMGQMYLVTTKIWELICDECLESVNILWFIRVGDDVFARISGVILRAITNSDKHD